MSKSFALSSPTSTKKSEKNLTISFLLIWVIYFSFWMIAQNKSEQSIQSVAIYTLD
jgi:hypothetical protein